MTTECVGLKHPLFYMISPIPPSLDLFWDILLYTTLRHGEMLYYTTDIKLIPLIKENIHQEK